MKILVLTCPTGGGHNTCAKYIKEEFNANHISCDVHNYLEIIGEKTSDFIEKIYLDSTKGQGTIFKNVYKLGELYNKSNITSPVYLFNKIHKEKLHKYLKANHYDLVICTHLFPSMALTSLKKEDYIPFINVATDYECIPFWNETNPDYFVIPSELLKSSFINKGIKEDILLPFGIPVASNFSKIVPSSFDLPEDKKIIMLISGSMGFGNMLKLVKELLNNIKDVYFLVICGNNKDLEVDLKLLNNPNLIVIGYTKEINYFMKKSTIIITKPGGLTTSEVATLNKPLIHMMPIPGVENYNADFFAENQMSLKASNIEEVIKCTQKLLTELSLQKTLVENQKRIINKNSASDLVDFVQKTYIKKEG